MSESPEFLTRDEILGGLPARRASTVLFAIEARAAQLDARAQRAMARFCTRQAVEDEERAFLRAVTEGRAPFRAPTIQIVERYSQECGGLVPKDAGVRAALARLLASKYGLERNQVPRLRASIGWDTEAVQNAYLSAYGKPLETIYLLRSPLGVRARWLWENISFRIENMPPFASAYALTLTETVGATILALPIALAGVGAIAGLVLLLLLGLVNLFTITAVSEAVIRNGNMRYWRGGYWGELIGSYLGGGASRIFTGGLIILIFVTLIAYYLGVSTTLANASGVREEFWALGLFLVNLYFLRRQSLSATVAFALIIGIINIGLVLLLSLLALPHVQASNLLFYNLPLIGGRPLDPSDLRLIFGVVLLAYFGHTSTANCARVVLRRDPSGRSLIWGNAAAMLTAIVLYCIWVIAMNGAIEPQALIAQTGTVLTPLAAKSGSLAQVLGSLYVILGMGMASVHFTLGLFNQVRQWVPTQIMRRVLGARSQFWLGMAPIIAVFLIIEYLLVTNRGSYAGTLGFLGVLKGSLIGGIFPVLMLVASRRKGEYVPGFAMHWLAHPLLIGCIYGVFLAGILLHGTVIWQDMPSRLAALAVGAVALIMPIVFMRGNIFKPRTTIELRGENSDDNAVFGVTANGHYLPSIIGLSYANGIKTLQAAYGEIENFSELRAMTVDLPSTSTHDLKVWVHQISTDEVSEWLAAKVRVTKGTDAVVSTLIDREKVLPLAGDSCQVEIYLLPSEEAMAQAHA